MDDAIQRALQNDRIIDITTTGSKTGEPRRIEIWMHATGDTYIITGRPGKRDWYANLLANPSFTVHLKQSAQADLPAQARPVTDAKEKERLLRAAPSLMDHIDDSEITEWVARSPMVEVTVG